jgi:methylthioxylose transferase
VAATLALYRSPVGWPWRVTASAGLAALLALAVAALASGPAGWGAPFNYAGEYPAGVSRVGAIPTFLREFPGRLPELPSHATGHPAGAMVVYALVARVWSGLTAAALVTVAVGSLGAVAAGGLARDELGERGGRLALAVWVVAPGVVLYLATSADAVFAAVLGAAALAAHRGLVRRSPAWTLAGGALLWASSMLTYAAVLLLVFLGVRAFGLLEGERRWVVCWAAGTSAVVVALAGGLWLATGYDVPAAVAAVHGAYQAAPGSAGRSLGHWMPGDLRGDAGGAAAGRAGGQGCRGGSRAGLGLGGRRRPGHPARRRLLGLHQGRGRTHLPVPGAPGAGPGGPPAVGLAGPAPGGGRVADRPDTAGPGAVLYPLVTAESPTRGGLMTETASTATDEWRFDGLRAL